MPLLLHRGFFPPLLSKWAPITPKSCFCQTTSSKLIYKRGMAWGAWKRTITVIGSIGTVANFYISETRHLRSNFYDLLHSRVSVTQMTREMLMGWKWEKRAWVMTLLTSSMTAYMLGGCCAYEHYEAPIYTHGCRAEKNGEQCTQEDRAL